MTILFSFYSLVQKRILLIFKLRSSPQQSDFQLSANATQRQREFLGVLAAGEVNASSLEDPLQALCQDRAVHWTRRADGEGTALA